MLRPLPVDLEELAMILEGDPVQGGGRIDLRTGEVWPQSALEYAEEVGEIDEDDDDPERWLWVHCEGSRDGYRDMEWFIDDLDDPDFADRLARAISGRGAFRRFKDRLSDRPELMTRWYAFSNDRQRGRARSWLAAEGYTPSGRECAGTARSIGGGKTRKYGPISGGSCRRRSEPVMPVGLRRPMKSWNEEEYGRACRESRRIHEHSRPIRPRQPNDGEVPGVSPAT